MIAKLEEKIYWKNYYGTLASLTRLRSQEWTFSFGKSMQSETIQETNPNINNRYDRSVIVNSGKKQSKNCLQMTKINCHTENESQN